MSDAMNAAEYPMQSRRKDCVNGTCICEVRQSDMDCSMASCMDMSCANDYSKANDYTRWSEKVVSGLWKSKTVVLVETVVETRVSPAHVPLDSMDVKRMVQKFGMTRMALTACPRVVHCRNGC